MEGDHLLSSHYVIYIGVFNIPSREAARAGCEAKGLELCSKSAITNFELCGGGWLTDGAGWWMNSVSPGCVGAGYNAATWLPTNYGAYCCGRPYFLPEDRASYPYTTREQGLAACQSRGMGLCSKSQIQGFELCSYGWVSIFVRNESHSLKDEF